MRGAALTAFYLAVQMIAMIGIGVFIRKRRLVSPEFDSSLTSFLIHIALPCMIVNSLYMDFSPQELWDFAKLLALSLLLLAFYFALGQLSYLVTGRGFVGRALRFGMIFSNFTFMGLPVIEALYGQEGLFSFVIFVIPFRLAYYSSAKPLLTPAGRRHPPVGLAATCKDWFSPPVTAALVGLVIYVAQIPLPGPLVQVVASVGSVASPMGMILCGLSLGSFDWRSMCSLAYAKAPLARNVLVPALTTLLLLPLPLDPLTKKMVVVFAALPVASLLAAFTIQYDPDEAAKRESAGAVFYSTLLSAVTVPLWSFAAELIF